MTRRDALTRWGLPLVVAAAAGLAPRSAAACGGTFCDTGPTAMPVDQSGENILFWSDGATVEAHVQIEYEGEAERFAWVIPMPAVPEVEIGSQPLFLELLNGTVPSYGFTQSFSCQQGLPAPEGGGGLDSNEGTVNEGGVNVVFRKAVGAFVVTAITGGSGQAVIDWLGANGYQNVPAAPALFDDYATSGHVFTAIKLTAGAEVDEIHPLVFRYPGARPMIPLKLTAVAAVEDMGVRVFFLGERRMASMNYTHLTLNPVLLDWQNFAANYNDVVSAAADAAGADGHGFVTEYAGTSAVVSRSSIFDSRWNASVFIDLEYDAAFAELVAQDMVTCGSTSCEFEHPLLGSMLQTYMPAPAGVDEDLFYACPGCYRGQFDPATWDSVGFAKDYLERIIVPGQKADALLDANPYLTRLFTTISPSEMTEDPAFFGRDDLPDVPARNIGQQLITEEGRVVMTLPDQREVVLDEDGNWPVFGPDMPVVERIEMIPARGEITEIASHTDAIDAALLSSNDALGGVPEDDCGVGGLGGSGGSSGSGGVIGGGSGGTAGEGTSTGTADDGGPPERVSGCVCNTTPARRPAPMLWALVGASVLVARRRRAVP